MGDGRLHELPNQRNVVAGVAAFQPYPAAGRSIAPGSGPRLRHFRQRPATARSYRNTHRRDRRARRSGDHDRAPSAQRAGRRARSDRTAAAWLGAAKKPLVILGGGAVSGAAEALALVEHLDAPVVNTVNAKGILPPGHPLRAGENMAFQPVRRSDRSGGCGAGSGHGIRRNRDVSRSQAARLS